MSTIKYWLLKKTLDLLNKDRIEHKLKDEAVGEFIEIAAKEYQQIIKDGFPSCKIFTLFTPCRDS